MAQGARSLEPKWLFMPSASILHRTARELGMAHVRLAHGTFVRADIVTVAILAQGTNRGDALCAALFLNRVSSNPRHATFLFLLKKQ